MTMASIVVDREMLAPSAREREDLARIETLLDREPVEAPQLLIDGERIEMPPSLLSLLVRVIQSLEDGERATLIPGNMYLTTQQAAELLGMSRQYLVRLLENGEIPFSKTGTHRRILAADLMRYKRKRAARSRAALAHLTALSEELGLYESTDQPLPEWKRLDELPPPGVGKPQPPQPAARTASIQ